MSTSELLTLDLDLDLDLDVRATTEVAAEEDFGFGDTKSSTSPNLTFGVQTMCPSCC